MSYCIQTNSGIKFDLQNPTLDMIDINDIAIHLSLCNRYAGATGRVYTVAQHSYLVCGLAPLEYKLEALLHDAAEAYTHDITTGLKKLMRRLCRDKHSPYDRIVDRIEDLIAEKFKLNISSYVKAIIKPIDSRLCLTEKKCLLKEAFSWELEQEYTPYDFKIIPEMTYESAQKFLGFYELYRRDKEDASN